MNIIFYSTAFVFLGCKECETLFAIVMKFTFVVVLWRIFEFVKTENVQKLSNIIAKVSKFIAKLSNFKSKLSNFIAKIKQIYSKTEHFYNKTEQFYSELLEKLDNLYQKLSYFLIKHLSDNPSPLKHIKHQIQLHMFHILEKKIQNYNFFLYKFFISLHFSSMCIALL